MKVEFAKCRPYPKSQVEPSFSAPESEEFSIGITSGRSSPELQTERSQSEAKTSFIAPESQEFSVGLASGHSSHKSLAEPSQFGMSQADTLNLNSQIRRNDNVRFADLQPKAIDDFDQDLIILNSGGNVISCVLSEDYRRFWELDDEIQALGRALKKKYAHRNVYTNIST